MSKPAKPDNEDVFSAVEEDAESDGFESAGSDEFVDEDDDGESVGDESELEYSTDTESFIVSGLSEEEVLKRVAQSYKPQLAAHEEVVEEVAEEDDGHYELKRSDSDVTRYTDLIDEMLDDQLGSDSDDSDRDQYEVKIVRPLDKERLAKNAEVEKLKEEIAKLNKERKRLVAAEKKAKKSISAAVKVTKKKTEADIIAERKKIEAAAIAARVRKEEEIKDAKRQKVLREKEARDLPLDPEIDYKSANILARKMHLFRGKNLNSKVSERRDGKIELRERTKKEREAYVTKKYKGKSVYADGTFPIRHDAARLAKAEAVVRDFIKKVKKSPKGNTGLFNAGVAYSKAVGTIMSKTGLDGHALAATSKFPALASEYIVGQMGGAAGDGRAAPFGYSKDGKPVKRLMGNGFAISISMEDYKALRDSDDLIDVNVDLGFGMGPNRVVEEVTFVSKIDGKYVMGSLPMMLPRLDRDYSKMSPEKKAQYLRVFGLDEKKYEEFQGKLKGDEYPFGQLTEHLIKHHGKLLRKIAVRADREAGYADKFIATENESFRGEGYLDDSLNKSGKKLAGRGARVGSSQKKLGFIPRSGDAHHTKKGPDTLFAEEEFDIFNYVGDESNLTHQNVQSLLRTSLIKSGKTAEECDEMLGHNVTLAIISEDESLDNLLRDAILNFIGNDPPQDRASIALCRGAIVGGQIIGNTHWSALHLRRIVGADGKISIKAYHMDSISDKVPTTIARVLDSIGETVIGDLDPATAEGAPYQRAIAELPNVTFEACEPLPCVKQKDGYSCGYRTVFNMVRMHAAADVTALADSVMQDAVVIDVDKFIHDRKEDLKANFNPAVDERVKGCKESIADFDVKDAEIELIKAVVESISISSEGYIAKLEKLIAIEKSVRDERPDAAKDLSKLNIEILYRKILFGCVETLRCVALIVASEAGEEPELPEEFLEKLCNAKTAQNPELILPLLEKIIKDPAALFTQIEELEKELEAAKSAKPSASPKDALSSKLAALSLGKVV